MSKLTISRTMELSELGERMSPNGDEVSEAQAAAMRAMLADNAASYGWATTDDVEDSDWLRMLHIAQRMDEAEASRVQIVGEFRALNSSEAGHLARIEYAEALRQGKSPDEAEIMGSNVLQRNGFRVNQQGGASFAVGT